MRAQIIAALHTARFRYSSEAELQNGIAQALTAAGIEHEPEAALSAGERIDFLVGAVGIEVKVGGSAAEVFRQLMRYAESPRIDSLIVVTDKVRIARGLPDSALRKHIDVVSLAEGSL